MEMAHLPQSESITQLVIVWKTNVMFAFILSRKGSGRFSRSPEKCFHCISCDMDRAFLEIEFPLL